MFVVHQNDKSHFFPSRPAELLHRRGMRLLQRAANFTTSLAEPERNRHADVTRQDDKDAHRRFKKKSIHPYTKGDPKCDEWEDTTVILLVERPTYHE